jgi:hypothetical protein
MEVGKTGEEVQVWQGSVSNNMKGQMKGKHVKDEKRGLH